MKSQGCGISMPKSSDLYIEPVRQVDRKKDTEYETKWSKWLANFCQLQLDSDSVLNRHIWRIYIFLILPIKMLGFPTSLLQNVMHALSQEGHQTNYTNDWLNF